ncbi:BZ3500_MvSof-1268-A1-R1_Chr9g10768 [Microbotryum saponariae]|uniref:BZ3500_MvSof-1268-A1-R1_Chr9g10768 protein n=1 Tax=Microbotryum saponariae TaxID=289078 RepID=A0A2X0N625_9BASI|nr:BZ3501_MvSof-1269-A2-R1_Chr9g10516 [Microbotryum saponariae]SDA00656.1 BZ3500_MvSof-1268-A1-R1_Chr9g10768 [Microbotryum saponariae]
MASPLDSSGTSELANGAILIQQVGLMLKAQVDPMTQILFQRFWFVTSLKHFGIRDIGLGALFLASKLEESPLRIRDLINCYAYLLEFIAHQGRQPTTTSTALPFDYVPMDYFASSFYDTKDALVVAEMQLLKRLGFQTQSSLPYGHLVNYLKVLELTSYPGLVKQSWGYANDMLQTPSPALYPPSTLAVAAIYLATRKHDPPIALPLVPEPWWVLFDATEEDVVDVCTRLLDLYRQWKLDAFGEADKAGVWKVCAKLPHDKQAVRDLIEVATTRNNKA